MAPIRQKILDSARLKWESERERARNNYHLSVDPSSAPGQRDEAEQRARTILRDVISSFGEGVSGVDEFVQEARRLQSEFGYKLCYGRLTRPGILHSISLRSRQNNARRRCDLLAVGAGV